MQVRSAHSADRELIWALSRIPNIGATADPSFPELKPIGVPPPEFPDLADVPDTFVAAGGDFFVIEADARILGMGGYKRTSSDEAQALRVRVHPAFRRQGIGRRLMQAIEMSATANGVERVVLETADHQPEAIAFYESIGYSRTGTESRPGWTWTLVWIARQLR